MNKKLFLGMFVAAGMLLATSCSNDELDVVQSGNEAQVTFSLGLEGGLATRAISDGTGAKKLVYAVYKLNAQGQPELQKVVGSDENSQFVDDAAFDNGLTETVEITLAKGQTYQVAFWAQNESCTAYTTTDLRNVVVNYAGNNNDETRDAFFKTVEFTVTGSTSIDVELRRPFAQINVGVTEADWNAAAASGVTISESKVVIKNAAKYIDLLTGEVNGEVEVEYGFSAIPTDPAILEVDVDRDGAIQDDEKYKYLSMSYILTSAERTTLESDGLQFTFKSGGNDIVFDEGLHQVPVQRNWRTNILGKILTGDIQFNITIDPAYDNDYNFPLYLLKDAFANGGQMTLTEDFTLSEGMTVAAGADAEIALDDNTLTVANSTTVLGNLTISGGEVDVNIPRTDNSTKLAFLADNGSVINVTGAQINVAKGNMAFAIFNKDYNYHDIETTINIENSTISGEGRGIVSPFGAKSVEINLINSSVHEIFLDGPQEAVVTVDATSTVENFGIDGTAKLTVKYPADNKPNVSGAAANITFVEI